MPDAFSKLVEAGWFAGWPASAVERAHQRVQATHDAEDPGELNWYYDRAEQYPGLLMCSVLGDTECIHEEASYTELLREFEQGSHGLLTFQSIEETWIEDDDGEINAIVLRVTANGVEFEQTLEFIGDWIADEFHSLLRRIMRTTVPGVVIYIPDSGGQDFGALFINETCLSNNDSHQLLPHFDNQAISEDDDEEYFEGMCRKMCEDYEDIAPIYFAVYRHDLEAVKEFVESGGNFQHNDPDKGEFSPFVHIYHASSITQMHLAERHLFPKYEAVFDYMLSRGANLDEFATEVISEQTNVETDEPFYHKLKNMGYRPPASVIDDVESILADAPDSAKVIERFRRDFVT